MKKIIISTMLLASSGFGLDVMAHCSHLHGVTLCDNGDVEIERFDGVYSLIGDTLTIYRYEDYLYGYARDYYDIQPSHYSGFEPYLGSSRGDPIQIIEVNNSNHSNFLIKEKNNEIR